MNVDEAQALDDSANRLSDEFRVEATAVRSLLERAKRPWRDASIHDFVPILAERRVRSHLRGLSGSDASTREAGGPTSRAPVSNA